MGDVLIVVLMGSLPVVVHVPHAMLNVKLAQVQQQIVLVVPMGL